MEGLRVIQVFVGAMVFLGFVGVVLVVYAWGIRWLWRERGKGFAEGWYEVADRRLTGAGPESTARAASPGLGESTTESRMIPPPAGTWAPEPTKRAPVGPPRYLVPTEKE